ncbi:swi5-dependent recombination DNA repair protein 1 homolog isoform X2 [Esox lucius]|nr:swi5-dependent recombination DNA repair protein 1 homolog isoform X2 [Esox lucius]
MSFSLKERLKRSRRSFTSPVSVVKRLKISEDDDQQPQMNIDNRNDTQPTENRRAEVPGCMPETFQPSSTDLLERQNQLQKEVKERTETLRRLKMVKMYRGKNDLTQLRILIDKWRRCSQAALYDLQSDVLVDGKKTSISQLIDLFGLEDGILHFDRTEEDFTSA